MTAVAEHTEPYVHTETVLWCDPEEGPSMHVSLDGLRPGSGQIEIHIAGDSFGFFYPEPLRNEAGTLKEPSEVKVTVDDADTLRQLARCLVALADRAEGEGLLPKSVAEEAGV